jgi:hypothetical protein
LLEFRDEKCRNTDPYNVHLTPISCILTFVPKWATPTALESLTPTLDVCCIKRQTYMHIKLNSMKETEIARINTFNLTE